VTAAIPDGRATRMRRKKAWHKQTTYAELRKEFHLRPQFRA
jgi:hypothetical protein